MPIRPMTAGKKSANKKLKKTIPKDDELEVIIDPQQEQIDGLIREREEIRLKLNRICSRIIENINIDNYNQEIDLTKQQPSDISLENILMMIDEICLYRTTFLNLYQEHDDQENIPVQNKITQLSVEDPILFRKRLTSDQRLTFVVRERDLWKENAQLLQIMYATIVDQLEMGIFKKLNFKTSDILRAHRLNLEDVCLIFASPTIRLITDAQKCREKATFHHEMKEQQPIAPADDLEQQPTNSISQEKNNHHHPLNETKEHPSDSSPKTKRNVSFADEVNIIDHEINIEPQEQQPKEKPLPMKSRLPLASDTLVDRMDSNLRMLIIKELSKDSYIERPPSKMSFTYGTNPRDSPSPRQQQNRPRKKNPEWVNLARLVGIDESEIEHWLSQSLQYPAGRVISTWCNSTSPSPTVAELHSLLSSNNLNRTDLVRSIETMYNIT